MPRLGTVGRKALCVFGLLSLVARWSSGSSPGSYPGGRRFDPCPRNLMDDRIVIATLALLGSLVGATWALRAANRWLTA